MEKPVLLLNATYEPLKVLSWQKAIMLYFSDKVEIVEEYDDFDLNSPSITIKCPSVIRLKKYVRGDKTKVKFSRSNIFARDQYTCQYCGKQPGVQNLTFDHLRPRASGGKTEWSNIVTACYPCNSKKGDKSLAEAKMYPKQLPFKPDHHPTAHIRWAVSRTPDSWASYLS
jgi:5-methylcytosine-specific restriction endonuclease McrA